MPVENIPAKRMAPEVAQEAGGKKPQHAAWAGGDLLLDIQDRRDTRRDAARLLELSAGRMMVDANDTKVVTDLFHNAMRQFRSQPQEQSIMLSSTPLGPFADRRPGSIQLGASVLVLRLPVLQRFPSQIHCRHRLSTVRHMAHRVDREVPVMQFAVQNAKRDLGAGLAVPEAVLHHGTSLASHCQRASVDVRRRLVAPVLAHRIVRGTEEGGVSWRLVPLRRFGDFYLRV